MTITSFNNMFTLVATDHPLALLTSSVIIVLVLIGLSLFSKARASPKGSSDNVRFVAVVDEKAATTAKTFTVSSPDASDNVPPGFAVSHQPTRVFLPPVAAMSY